MWLPDLRTRGTSVLLSFSWSESSRLCVSGAMPCLPPVAAASQSTSSLPCSWLASSPLTADSLLNLATAGLGAAAGADAIAVLLASQGVALAGEEPQ